MIKLLKHFRHHSRHQVIVPDADSSSDRITIEPPEESNCPEIMKASAMVCRFLVRIRREIALLNRRITDIQEQYHVHVQRLENSMTLVADCQRKTADLINQKIERHALYPAVKSVNALASVIFELSAEADRLVQLYPENPAMPTLHHLLSDAERLAHDKQASLDIFVICPTDGDFLDSKRHEIVKAVVTDNAEQHGLIESTVTAGFVYRDEVLRPAKVCIYRFMEIKNQEPI